ncbi:MAG: GNAT family N-acetyltransferase [Acidobacteriota bacterium]
MTTARVVGTRLDWDSAFFGVPIGKAQAEMPSDVDVTEAWAAHEGMRCVFLLMRADRLDVAQAAERHGFFLTGVRVTFERLAALDVATAPQHGVVVRPARSADIAVLEQIAARSHRDTRFYADPNFSRASCGRLYETWIRRSCEGWADHVLTAEHDGRLAGYITLHCRAEGQGIIGLVAVAENSRRLGVGRALVGGALEWFRDRGLKRASVVTQAQNAGAQGLYQHAGFSVCQVDLWMHKWY